MRQYDGKTNSFWFLKVTFIAFHCNSSFLNRSFFRNSVQFLCFNVVCPSFKYSFFVLFLVCLLFPCVFRFSQASRHWNFKLQIACHQNWWNNFRLFEKLLWQILFICSILDLHAFVCALTIVWERDRALFCGFFFFFFKMGTSLIWFTKQWFKMNWNIFGDLFCVFFSFGYNFGFRNVFYFILFSVVFFSFIVAADICYVSLNNIDDSFGKRFVDRTNALWWWLGMDTGNTNVLSFKNVCFTIPWNVSNVQCSFGELSVIQKTILKL